MSELADALNAIGSPELVRQLGEERMKVAKLQDALTAATLLVQTGRPPLWRFHWSWLGARKETLADCDRLTADRMDYSKERRTYDR